MTNPKSKTAPAKNAPAVFLAVTAVMLVSFGGECLGQTSFKERIHFDVGTGWGSYDMKRGAIKDSFYEGFYFDEFANTRIEGGREYSGEIVYDYSRKISIGAGIIYSGGDGHVLEDLQTFLDDYINRRPRLLLYEASFSAPYLKLQYRSFLDVLTYSVDLNLYYGFASLDGQIRDIDTIPPGLSFEGVNFRSKDMGYSLSLGFSFSVTGGFALINKIGYRRLVVDNLKDSDGNSLSNFELDFSGYYIRGGISVNPWN